MTDLVHPYEKLTLVQVGWPIAIYLISTHVFMLVKADYCKEWLNKLPRHYNAGVIMITIGLGWFWLLIGPENNPIIPAIGKLSANLAEFNAFKKTLQIAVPLFLVGMCLYVREFLFVRGLGLVALMAAGPILQGGMFKDEPTRILIPIFAYLILTVGMYCVGMPFLFRDTIKWVTADNTRWNALVWAGLVYGIAVLTCTILLW